MTSLRSCRAWSRLPGRSARAWSSRRCPGQRHGYYELQSRRIAVRQDIAANAQIKTLIHELAHALLRAEPCEDDPSPEQAEEELVVELVAFTVCGSLGLDSSGYSIPYLASWARRGDINTIERMAGLIDRLARRIENATAAEEGRDV
jgi:antirestriction protein ArdC